MARVKPEGEPIQTAAEADSTLEELARIQREIDRAEGELNKQIEKARAAAAGTLDPLVERRTRLETSLAVYAKANRDRLFAEKKTVERPWGRFGFRVTSRISVGKRTVELLTALFGGSGVRLKEEPDKEVLGEWSDEDLKKVEAKRVVKDDFWYETNTEVAAVQEGA